jgi:transposase
MIGGMDRQALRDWVHRFDEADPDRQLDNWASGPAPGLSVAQKADLTRIAEVDFDRKVDGVVRWRRIELKRVFAKWFGVDYCERYVGMHFRKVGFSHISARPRHRTKDAETGAGTHFLRKSARADSSMTMVRTFIARNARRSLVPAGIQVDASVA